MVSKKGRIMVQGINSNNAAYPINAPQPVQNPVVNNQPVRLPEQAMDEFVTQLELQHKKNVRKKNIISGTIAAASALALAGGTLLKNKWGRLISIAPIGLTALGVGITGLVKGNKTPDFRSMLNSIQNNQPNV